VQRPIAYHTNKVAHTKLNCRSFSHMVLGLKNYIGTVLLNIEEKVEPIN